MIREFEQYSARYAELLKDPVRDHFASGDDRFFHARKWKLIREFFQGLNLPIAQTTWLDVGCGRGELLRMGAGCFQRTCGCDLAAGMMEGCDDLEVSLQPEPCKLPYDDESFGFVTAVCVFHHVAPEDRAGLMREIVRTLKPGGYACMIEHNPYNPVTRGIVRRTPIDANASLLTPKMVSGLFSESGLAVERTTFFLYLPERLYRWMPGLERWLAWIPAGGQFATFARKPQQERS